jgi:uncharacterized protein involved in outer membrane biogenesis
MRRLVVVLAVVAVLAAGVLGAAFVTLSRLVDANRGRLIAKASKRIGRAVSVERVSVGFRRGLAITLDGIRIGEDPSIGPDAFLTAERAYAVVRLLPLARGRVEIRRVVVEAPRAIVVRTADGTSLDTLGRRRNANAARRRRKPGPPSPERTDGRTTMLAFVVLEDGELRVVDRRGAEPVETIVAPIEVWLSDPSLDQPIGFRARGTVTGSEPVEVTLQGRFGPLGKPPLARDVPLAVFLGVQGGSVWVSNVALNGTVRRDRELGPVATLEVTAPTMRIGGADVRDLVLNVSETNGGTEFRTHPVKMLGGTIELKGRIDRRGDTPTFAVTPVVRGVDVSQLVAASDPEAAARIRGRLDADGSLTGSPTTGMHLRRSLGGEVHVTVHEGALAGVNVAEEVLSGLSGFGGLATLVPGRVRDRHPEIFAGDDMHFDELRADLRITAGRIDVDPVVVTTKDYAARGKGVVGVANRSKAMRCWSRPSSSPPTSSARSPARRRSPTTRAVSRCRST